MIKTIDVDFSQIQKLEAELEVFNNKAYPNAVKHTINKAAFIGRSVAQTKIRKELINRNKWTTRSIRVDKAHGSRVNAMESEMGSTADYMKTQEFGGVRHSEGSKGVPIPTAYAAGQSEKVVPRTRLPRRRNQLSNIHLSKTRGGIRGRKAGNMVAIQQAAATGRRDIYLKTSRSEGIFRVVGSGKRIRIKMLYDLSRKSVIIPRHQIIEPAGEIATSHVPNIFLHALEFQQKRLGIFTGRG